MNTLSLGLLALVAVTTTPAAAPQPYALFKPGQLCHTESAGVLRAAQAALSRPPFALPYLHAEGTLPHKGIYDQSRKSQADWPSMFALALAYRTTHNAADLKALDQYMQAWLSTYHPSFNPIDETSLDNMIYALDLVQPDLSPALQQQAHTFLQQLAQGYLAPRTTHKPSDTNNWQSHRIKLGTLAAFALGDPALIMQARHAFELQLKNNIKSDGSSIDFHQRDALHYQTYDLEPLLAAALAAQQHGQNWFALNNHALDRALNFLAPYAKGEQTHQEFVHSQVAFDAARDQAGMAGFSGLWNPQMALLTYHLAALLDPKWQDLAEMLGRSPSWLQAVTACQRS